MIQWLEGRIYTYSQIYYIRLSIQYQQKQCYAMLCLPLQRSPRSRHVLHGPMSLRKGLRGWGLRCGAWAGRISRGKVMKNVGFLEEKSWIPSKKCTISWESWRLGKFFFLKEMVWDFSRLNVGIGAVILCSIFTSRNAEMVVWGFFFQPIWWQGFSILSHGTSCLNWGWTWDPRRQLSSSTHRGFCLNVVSTGDMLDVDFLAKACLVAKEDEEISCQLTFIFKSKLG